MSQGYKGLERGGEMVDGVGWHAACFPHCFGQDAAEAGKVESQMKLIARPV